MTWHGDVTAQVERDFREAARLKGAHSPDEDVVKIGPRPAERRRNARIVGREES
jgi:hypothetical protein